MSFDTKSWCAVHVHKNKSLAINGEECAGELPNTQRPKHLARSEFESLRQSRIFHIKTWDAGH